MLVANAPPQVLVAGRLEGVEYKIVTFANARLDDDERYARVFLALGERLKENPPPGLAEFSAEVLAATINDSGALQEAEHWKCQAPPDLQRALREAAAKRAIVTRYETACRQADVAAVNGGGVEQEAWEKIAGALELDVRSIASVWSDHPDYRAALDSPVRMAGNA